MNANEWGIDTEVEEEEERDGACLGDPTTVRVLNNPFPTPLRRMFDK